MALRALDGDGWAHHSGINRCCSTLERAAVSIDVGDLLSVGALHRDFNAGSAAIQFAVTQGGCVAGIVWAAPKHG
jgi:hypothetical protein